MPSPGRGSQSPLANLPRPLSERERRRPWIIRRGLPLVGIGALLAGGFALATGLSGGPLAPVGDVQGAIATTGPTRSPMAVPTDAPRVAASPRPAAVATPTPVPTPAPPATLTGYRWPLPRGRLTLPFGPTPWGSRIVDGEKFHDGIDVATFCGDRIVAAHDGTVLAAGRRYDAYMGWIGDLQPYLDRLDRKKLWPTLPIVVVVDDGNGYRSVYAHFGKVKVKNGQVVRAGQLLGWEGATGRASGCHLHYELFSPLETGTIRLDPKLAKRMKLPERHIARVDPLLVLPPRPKDPKPTPAAGASAAPAVSPRPIVNVDLIP